MRLKRYIGLILWLFVAFSPAHAQQLLYGVKVGVPVTDYFETGLRYSSATRRYTVGLAAEWRFSEHLGLELDGLYKRIGYAGVTSFGKDPIFGFGNERFNVSGNSWDFPLMIKYRALGKSQLYVSAGGNLRYISSARALGTRTETKLVPGEVPNRPVTATFVTPFDTSDPLDLRKRVYPGITFSAGVEIGTSRLRLLPEIRYTRWTANIGGPLEFSSLRFSPNQFEFLVGVSF